MGPFGIDEIRTAWFTERASDGEPSVTVLVSTGLLPCTIDAADATNGEFASLLVAACREGSQHLALDLHDPEARWDGTFLGRPEDSAVGRRAAGSWYGVDEAFLVQISGIDRAYLSATDRSLSLGEGGRVEAALDDDALAVEAWFPEGVSARFRADRCEGPAQLLELVRADPGFYCASPPFGYRSR